MNISSSIKYYALLLQKWFHYPTQILYQKTYLYNYIKEKKMKYNKCDFNLTYFIKSSFLLRNDLHCWSGPSPSPVPGPDLSLGSNLGPGLESGLESGLRNLFRNKVHNPVLTDQSGLSFYKDQLVPDQTKTNTSIC